MIFKGRNQVPYSYSRFGWTRGGGKTWHGGIDVVGLDDTTARMPDYEGKSISGTVVSARIVPEGSADPTWEWGNYVCVQLDAKQTPDTVNFLYFCHNEKNLVSVGQKVKSGDALAIMGNTGNAKYANPPIKHVHLECRATRTGTGIDPTKYAGVLNKVGVYGTASSESKAYTATAMVDGLRVRPFPAADDENANEAIAFLTKGEKYPLVQTRDGWAFLMTGENAGGWCALNGDDGTVYLKIEEA